MKEYNFFAYISRMKNIDRWALMRNTRNENIQEHSYDVAVLAHALALIANKRFEGKFDPERAAMYALFHDTNEIITGDMPTPVKYYNPEIKEAYKKLEDISKDKLLAMLPDYLREEYRELFFFEKLAPEYKVLIKAADKISAYIKCIEEGKAGNAEFRKAENATKAAVRELKFPAADYFLDTFIPPYTLTLDELD